MSISHTTVVLRVLEFAGRTGTGFYAQELRSPRGRGARVGFDVVALGSARRPLACVGAASLIAPGVEVVRVTAENRDGLAREVAERVGTRGW